MEAFNHKKPEHWLRLPYEIGSAVVSEVARFYAVQAREVKWACDETQAVRRMVAETVYEPEGGNFNEICKKGTKPKDIRA